MKRIICLFLGHYTGTHRKVFEDGVPIQIIEGFGGFIFSGGGKSCLRCGKIMPKGFTRSIER